MCRRGSFPVFPKQQMQRKEFLIEMNEIYDQVKSLCQRAKAAAPALAGATGETRNNVLTTFAALLRQNEQKILAANEADMAAARESGLSAAMMDRLLLTPARLEEIACAMEALVMQEDPIGLGTVRTRPNGMEIKRIRVPLGVVGVIFESRPNVSADIAGLCIKSGNAAVLRGGKEAIRSNTAIVETARAALTAHGLPADCVSLIPFTDRAGAQSLMETRGLVDVLIPRGGKGLIQSVVENAKVPVIETGAGNCHLYIHADADADMAVSIAVNAKTSRPSVCNAIETILVHRDIAGSILPRLQEALGSRGVELRCCHRTLAVIQGVAATEADWTTEYDDLIVAVKIVDSLEEAVDHINRYSTGHSETIVTRDTAAASYFTGAVDSACVYVNVSTRFTDGGCFGLGAEVGIATQKLHARGPLGLAALTTEKYIISGEGQIRT